MEATILNMDRERELRWTFGAIKTFEKRGREILKRLDIKNERGQAIATAPMHAGAILSNFLRIADILEAAVGAAIGVSAIEGKKGEPSEASDAIEMYLQHGGSIEALQNEIYRAYLQATDPSSIPVWQENIAREAETRRINQEKQAARLEIARLELASDQEKIRKLSGSPSTPSGTPS